MRFLADFVYLLGMLLYLPVVLYHALVVGKNRSGWGQRLGFVPAFDRSTPRIWIHAVSLGEINATPTLVEALRRIVPAIDIVFSTTTDTGYARAVELYGQECVFRFPLDFSPTVSCVLNRVNPSMIVLVELEVWYNLVRMATARGVPVVVVNGRLTERSARRLGRLKRVVRGMFSDLAWVGAQDETIAARFRALGVLPDRLEVTSSMKWDSAAVVDQVEGADGLSQDLGIDRSRSLWVCGSTGPGEEELILDAYQQLLSDRSISEEGKQSAPRLAIIPRKPERFDEVARLIERRGLSCIRRSEHRNTLSTDSRLESTPNPAVILGDTMGELRKFYCLADVVFVGRTLVPLGGSDPMEVAALGKAMVVGGFTDNFDMPIQEFRKAGGIVQIESAANLCSAVEEILGDKTGADRMGARAREVVLKRQGATQRTAGAIVRVLKKVAPEQFTSAGSRQTAADGE